MVAVTHVALLHFLVWVRVAWAADQSVTIDGGDPQLRYITFNQDDTADTWQEIPRSSQGCDTPQHLTRRVGDFVTFTFTGTSVTLLGTRGPEGGLITYQFDGQNTTNTRSFVPLQCDQTLFEQLNLQLGQHTLVVYFSEKEVSSTTNALDGLLSIQRVRYTIPGGNPAPPSKPIGPIVGGVVGGVVALILLAILVVLWRRRKRKVEHRRNNRTPITPSPVTPRSQLTGNHPGTNITPFIWERTPQSPPFSAHQRPQPSPPIQGDSVHTEPEPSVISSNPSSSRSPPSSRPRGTYEQNSQERGEQYRSRPNTAPTLENDQLVERIALKLAEIMKSRANYEAAMPPLYDELESLSRDPREMADLRRRVEERVQDIQKHEDASQTAFHPGELVSPTEVPHTPREPLYPPLLQRRSTSYAIDPSTGYPIEKLSPPLPISPTEPRQLPIPPQDQGIQLERLGSLPPGAAPPNPHRSMSPPR
ncbi:hypothetical protein FRC03_000479 [Tulasnella sp. 419]|nr:hypothetical protein FRC03_000479 [Tulasnella sp. 419]